jgi:predicted RNase H-like HicB family nuclease
MAFALTSGKSWNATAISGQREILSQESLALPKRVQGLRRKVIIHKRAEMKFFSFESVIEKEEDDEGYFAYTPSLPGCFSNGRTIEETRQNIREALQEHVLSINDPEDGVAW